MRTHSVLTAWLLLLTAVPPALSQAPVIPPGSPDPVLRLQAGPTGFINTLAFSPDGRTLYSSGWDKVVRVWRLDAQDRNWQEAPAYRVPLGPGADGKINAIALSADGNWLAAAGSSAIRSRAGFRDIGVVYESLGMSAAMRQDQGVIYLFDVNTRAVKVLRAHRGPVFAMTFAPRPGAAKDEPPPLISAAREGNGTKDDPYVGAIRVWDPAKGTSEIWPGALPDLGKLGRPGLAAWRPAGQADRLQVAVAWQDGTFRVWDVAQGKDGLSEQKDARVNVVVAALPGRQRLYTGGLRSPRGYLQSWQTPAPGDLRKGELIPADLPADTTYIPLALTLFSSRPGGPLDQAAVALYTENKTEKKHIRLHLVDVDPVSGQFGKRQASIRMWDWAGSMPTLAAAPGGRYLAVVDPEGMKGHGIYLYDIPELLAKQDQAQPRLLSGVGELFSYASFVKGKQGLGLLLSKIRKKAGAPPRTEAAAGDVFFDFTKPGFTDGAGLRIDTPDLTGWQLTHQLAKNGDQDEHFLRVITPGGRSQKIPLTLRQRVTDFALLPPVKQGDVPLVAVAVEERGEPSLLLFNGTTGQLVRHFTGHDDYIRSLAFSSDGRLLVSAAEDQTVCVWTLTDLGELLGQHGKVQGVAVKDDPKGAKVARILAGSPAAGKLAVGDVIEGVMVKGQLKALKSAAGFYGAVWKLKPGDTITVQATGAGQVVLPVGQGVDERQPLLTLFATRPAGGDGGARDWVGWSPQGPYATSGPKGESRLGWHLNTGKPDAPTSFVKADQYRGKYYKEGLLKVLVARASLAPALDDLKKAEEAKIFPDPRVLVTVGGELLDAKDTDKQGVIPIQAAKPELRVQVQDLPADKIAAVLYALDGPDLQPFPRPAIGDWTANLAPLAPGKHTVRIVVVTPGGRQPDYTFGPLGMRYQLPPPEVETTLPRSQTVKRPQFDVLAKVSQEVPDQAVDITVSVNGKVVARPAGPDVKESVNLEKGRNTVAIVAFNKKALAGHEKRETRRIDLVVFFDPQAPQIVLTDLVPLVGGKTPADPLAVNPEQAVVLTVPKFRVRGTITAQEPLTAAALAGTALTGFQPGAKSLVVDQEVLLAKAGPQTLTLAVATKNARATLDVNLDYQPQLPRPVFVESPEGRIFYDEGKGAPEVALRFQLNPAEDPAPFAQPLQVTVLINGEKPAQAPVVARKNNDLTVKFTPRLRDSQVQVQLSATGAKSEMSEGIAVQYLQVPYGIQFVRPIEETRTPVVELIARVQSPLELHQDKITATVQGKAIPDVVVEKEAGRSWLIHLRNVSLDGAKGSKSAVRLQVANKDGPSRTPASWKVSYLGPEPKRPEVAILYPTDTNLRDPELTVRFRVTSESKLTYLALVNSNALPPQLLDVAGLPNGPVELKIALKLVPKGLRGKVNVAALVPNKDGYLEGAADLRLVPGPNTFTVRAMNEAGLQESRAVVVSFLPPPVRVVLDRLQPLDGSKAVNIEATDSGLVKTAAPQGRLVLHGRVKWNETVDERLKGVEQVFVRVNSVLQVDPVRLEMPAPGKPRERSFEVKIFLSKEQGNQIAVEVPGLPVEESDGRVYLMSCAKPVMEKRMLHLLMIGIGEKDGDAFKNVVLKALEATPVGSREFTRKGYDKGQVYGPLVDKFQPVTRADIFRQFLTIKKYMDALATRELYSHHVMVYYKGSEVESDAGKLLRLSEADLDKALKYYKLPLENLEKQLTEARGAQILLLDVMREAPTKVASAGPKLDDSKVARMSVAVFGKEQGAKATLISTLGQTLLRPITLGQANQEMQKKFSLPVLYSGFVPASMAQLVIGPAEKR